VRAATIDGIVATLTPLDSVDQEYLQDMLATLRYFTTPRELIDKLVVRFHWRPESDPNTDIVQLRVINLLKRWLKEHVDDSDVDSTSAITRLTTFIQNDVAKAPDEAIARWAEQLTRMAYEWQSLGTALKRSNSVRGSPVKTSPNFGNNLVDFTNTNPVGINLLVYCLLLFVIFGRHLPTAHPDGGRNVQGDHAARSVLQNGRQAPRERDHPGPDRPFQQDLVLGRQGDLLLRQPQAARHHSQAVRVHCLYVPRVEELQHVPRDRRWADDVKCATAQKDVEGRKNCNRPIF